MGIKEDIEKGFCRTQYIMVKSAVQALAKDVQTDRQTVARWLIKQAVFRLLSGWKKDAYGRMELSCDPGPAKRNISQVENSKGAERALHLIEETNSKYIPIYWKIEELVEVLKVCGHKTDSRIFVDEAEREQARKIAQNKKPGVAPPAMPQKEVQALHTRIAELEKELADVKKKGQGQPAMKEFDGQSSFRHVTDALKLVAAVQDRYLGETWDPNDNDTYPKKKDVVEWLKEQSPGMSNVAAEAIDRVAMPFSRSK